LGIDHLHPRIVRHKVYPNGAEIGRDQQRSPGDSRRVVNRRRPDDRSVRPLAYATPEFARELKIPNMEKPGQFLWPPPQPNLALQMIAAIRPDPFLVHEAAKGTYIEARNRRVLEDNRQSPRPSSASASAKSASNHQDEGSNRSTPIRGPQARCNSDGE
jgi:hypothetical protein